MLIGFIIVACVNMLFSHLFYSPKMHSIATENQELVLKYEVLQSRIASMQNKIKEIRHRDRFVYRKLFSSDTIALEGIYTPYPASKYAHLTNDDYSNLMTSTWMALDAVTRETYAASLSLDELQVLAKDKDQMTLAIPAVTGRKTEKEKFAGAMETYTIEPMMHNGVALQGGTTHYFGDGFARAFDITYTDRENKVSYPHQTSWGVSTRMIGAIIMTHGDDNGLILPPKVAPIQVAIIPVAQHKEGVLEKANEVKNLLAESFRVKLDDSDYSTGWKFSQYEMKGVPLRLELGPRDIENNSCVLVSRVTREKKFVSLDNLVEEVQKALAEVHNELYERAQKNLEEKMSVARDREEFLDIAQNHPGFIKAMWCGESECEDTLKELTGGVKSRCIPFVEENLSDKCVCCGKPAKHMVVWGRQY